MKLKKHLKNFVIILIKILDEQNKYRMYRRELIDLFNIRVNDKRYTINPHQFPKILNAQTKYKIENKGRKEYIFKEIEVNELDVNED